MSSGIHLEGRNLIIQFYVDNCDTVTDGGYEIAT